ncbi:MAG: EAL domain-containing protein [Campylobacterota bacterium]
MEKQKVKDVCKDLTLLYVEDDIFSQQSFLHLIEPLFFKTYVADDGKEGLEIYKSQKIDLVVTDIKMPKMNGFEMIKQIQEIDFDVVFAITTAHADSEFFIQAIDLGVGSYILKPIEKQRVLFALFEMAQMVHNKYKAKELEAVVKKLAISNEMIEKLSYYHPLTNLPNKKLLLKKIKNFHCNCALIYLNIDNFGSINDTQGMSVGDAVLQSFAKRFEDSEFSEQIFHMGADEFIVVVPTLDNKKHNKTDQIQRIFSQLVAIVTSAFAVNGSIMHITISGGVALMDGEDTQEVEISINNARNAMKLAKKSGKNALYFFDRSLQRVAMQRSQILRRLSQAYEAKHFFMLYQKQFDRSENIIGVEALIRWEDPKRGIISPGEFIPVAEESGFIIQLGAWILKETIRQLWEFQSDRDKSQWQMSVNISPLQFKNKEFVPILESLIIQYKIDASKLRLEITEGVLIDNISSTLQKLKKIKSLGCTISIDDFGTGYSSLQYLKKLPIDELKIDQSFIKNLVTDRSDETIVSTIVNMGKSFGFAVISEGVEEDEQFDKLKAIGCDYFQGFLFAKPSKDL